MVTSYDLQPGNGTCSILIAPVAHEGQATAEAYCGGGSMQLVTDCQVHQYFNRTHDVRTHRCSDTCMAWCIKRRHCMLQMTHAPRSLQHGSGQTVHNVCTVDWRIAMRLVTRQHQWNTDLRRRTQTAGVYAMHQLTATRSSHPLLQYKTIHCVLKKLHQLRLAIPLTYIKQVS